MILLSSNFNVLRWIGAHTLYQALHLHHRFRFHPLVEAEAQVRRLPERRKPARSHSVPAGGAVAAMFINTSHVPS